MAADVKPELPPSRAYSLAGLRLVSDLPLGDLVPIGDEQASETVHIRRAPVPAVLPGAVAISDLFAYDGTSLLMNIAHVARYLIRGNEILYDVVPSADMSDVRTFLLGSAFGLLCHQRGIVPLHSSAIDIAGGCAAFIGHSGAGKSTLAASLVASGHPLIADDVIYLRVASDGAVMAWPGIARLRLWQDAAEALGYDGPDIQREFRGYNKFLVPLPKPRDPTAPRRLERVYQLEAAVEGGGAQITRTQGASVLEVLLPNVYRLSLAESMGKKPGIFAVCAAIARHVPVFRFVRPKGFALLQSNLDCLEAHLRNAS